MRRVFQFHKRHVILQVSYQGIALAMPQIAADSSSTSLPKFLFDHSTGEWRESRQQQQLPRSLPPFKIPVRLLHLRQRIQVFDPQLELAVANHAEHRRGTLLQSPAR